MIKALYPGSFDPLSNGHLDIIKRASKIFDKLYVVVSVNQNKTYKFSVDERINMIKKVTKNLDNVEVVSYDGLIVNYCKDNDINILIRGMRNYQDYEAELSLYHFNRDINDNVETLIMLPSDNNIFISSSAIKELLSYDQDISKYVPKELVDEIKNKYMKK